MDRELFRVVCTPNAHPLLWNILVIIMWCAIFSDVRVAEVEYCSFSNSTSTEDLEVCVCVCVCVCLGG